MFREYDIRGKESAEELNEEAMYHIGRGFGTMLAARGISRAVVGHDARATSEAFSRAAIRGLRESGTAVVDIGLVLTPMSYFAQYHLGIDGLVMVTASHNPSGWNGVKLGTGPSKTLIPSEIAELYAIISEEAYASGTGSLEETSIREAYFSDILARASIRPLKVLVNAGNGTAGLFAPDLLRRTGCEVVEHYTNVDPSYPHYTANPDGTAMMEDTGSETTKHSCDIGLAFDGDGDRLGVVDEHGRIVWPDRYIALLARLILEKKPGARIVFDVKVSESLPEDIAAHGGEPIMWKTGHSYIKAKLAEADAALAGEMSGHIFFREGYYGFDDALFAALKVLEYLSNSGKKLSELVAGIPEYVSTPTIQAKTTDTEKYAVVEELTAEFKREGYRVVDVSGARVYMEDGWGLVRASSNTPTLVLRFEAKTEAGLKKIRSVFEEKLSRFPAVDPAWDASGD